MKYLIVLESPSKVPKVVSIIKKSNLPDTYVVKSSCGHIRDLDRKTLSIDVENNFKPTYQINEDKRQIVSDLKREFAKCDKLILGSDYDREGESIGFHISEILKIPKNERKRMVFTEITKNAIVNAIKEPVDLNMNMFNSQQARRILDRLIGYKLSPLLWKNIQSSMKKGQSLSAGRVQSVVNRIVIERENEIKKFSSSGYYRTLGNFSNKKSDFECFLNDRLKDKDEANDLLEICANATFKVSKITKKIAKRKPPAPFITSTLQQEASTKFRFSPKSTMQLAQKLYEGGYITYMRTDSSKLSEDILEEIKTYIGENYGEKYVDIKQYKSKSKNSQEAHEAIRPCDITLRQLESMEDTTMSISHVKLYNLIWKRTIASQMSPAKVENTTTHIDIVNDELNEHENFKDRQLYFIYKSEKILFDGFMQIYTPTVEPEDGDGDGDEMTNHKRITLQEGDTIEMNTIESTEKFTKPPHGRFTEASLVRKLEELGIGRPSTFSSMISTIQDRKYVEQKDIEGKKKNYSILTLKDYCIEEKTKDIKLNSEKNKLVPTQIGGIVNDFLMKNFEEIMDFNFTVTIENELDNIAQGSKNWIEVVKMFYNMFNPKVLALDSSQSLEKNKYTRVLGKDPKTKYEIVTYIAKYGPVVQLKNTDNINKSKFAPLKDIKMEEVTLEQALELLKYPYVLGKHQGKPVNICKGKYGVYIKYNNKNISLYGLIESEITLEKVVNIIDNGPPKSDGAGDGASASATNKPSVIKTIDDTIKIKNGKYGAYIEYRNPKAKSDAKPLNVKIYGKKKPEELNKEDCMILIKNKLNKMKK